MSELNEAPQDRRQLVEPFQGKHIDVDLTNYHPSEQEDIEDIEISRVDGLALAGKLISSGVTKFTITIESDAEINGSKRSGVAISIRD